MNDSQHSIIYNIMSFILYLIIFKMNFNI